MISLFLVEDERIARESIRDNVPWQEHDILFLGDAPDGEVALPQLLEKRPDILLTDIKMPFMDGLELARIVRKELPDTRIIILSGHNEFEYARKAITLGVNDYLLKPVSSRDILEAVDRSKAQILECRARRIERQSHSITQRELFFSNLYSGILMGPAQMLQRAAQLGISLAAGAYQIILTELDGVIPDREALRDKLYAAPMAYGSGFDGGRATFLLLAEDAAGLPPKLREFSAWLDALAGQEGLSVHLLPGKQTARLSDLPKAYHLLTIQKKQRESADSKTLSHSTSFQRDTLLDFLRTGKPSALPSFWAHYRPTIESGYSSFVYRCYLYTELFFVVHEFCQENRIPLPESLRQEDLLEKRILLTNSVDDFLTLACQLCEEVMEVRPGGSRHTPSAEQARAYIDRHYMDPELSLSSVANAVSVSPNHLSTLFKSKIGVGFSEYLTEVRIRQAKRLLITSDLRVSEVGERVGYQNMEYFSMLFKKTPGRRPASTAAPTRYETDESCSRRPENRPGPPWEHTEQDPGGVYGHPGGDVEYQPAGYRPVPPLFGRIPYPGGAGHFRKQADPHCPG